MSAAVLIHLGGGEQADKIATVHDNTSRLRVAARTLADPPTVSSVILTPGALQINAKTTQLLRANANYTDGTSIDVTGRCAWTTADADVATIGNGRFALLPALSAVLGDWPGQLVARKAGATTISCSFGGVTGTTSVVVGELVEVDLSNETNPDEKVEQTPEKEKEKPKKDEKKEPPKVEKKEEILAEMPPMEPEKSPKKEVEPPPEPPKDDKKIAIQQHQDEEEKANPEADYLADKNHHVEKKDQTQASITSTTENDKNPTPGTHAGKPTEQPGNGDKTVVAQDDNTPGAKVSPNVIPKAATTTKEPVVAQKDPPKQIGSDKGDQKTPAQNPQPAPTVAQAPQPKPTPPDGKGITAPPVAPLPTPNDGNKDPALATAPQSSAVAVAPSAVPPGPGNAKPKALPMLPPTPGGPKWVNGLGFGAKGEPGKPSISINEKVAKAAIGLDELDKLKKVEGEKKLSMHRGAWKSSSLERWRAAIENYVPGVKAGNQTNLGTAAVPWATYLAQIHVRLHPIFADTFVEGLSDLPAGHPLNDMKLITRMEIVMRPDGTIHHLGIVKPSGVTAFDIAALDAVDRAAPFGKAPDAIVSPDGLVYLHWEFHRDDMRCSNVNAYPYVLKEGQTPKAPEPKEPPKIKTEEKKGQLGSTKQPPNTF